jgi:serine/threonine-protein kinase RsbW
MKNDATLFLHDLLTGDIPLTARVGDSWIPCILVSKVIEGFLIRLDKEPLRMDSYRTVQISLPNQAGYERIAMESLASFARLLGFMPERVEDLKTAVSEACLNAMEHGNMWRPEAKVVVTMDFAGDNLTVTVIDEGRGMGELPPEPDVERKLENLETPVELGTFLIKRLTDHVAFNQMTRHGHEVRMTVRRTR